jgi:GAF domain-containing protein
MTDIRAIHSHLKGFSDDELALLRELAGQILRERRSERLIFKKEHNQYEQSTNGNS